jgi:bifunctional oligoribonuclease and PAP phosphatase NrnA
MHISLRDTGNCLLRAQKIVITAHINPDGDAIGSSLGLMHALQYLGKDVSILIDDDIPVTFSILPGYELIEKPVKPVSCDLLVVLDTGLERLGQVRELVESKSILNIDHHISNDNAAEFLYLDAERAATAEIICQLFKEMGWGFSLQAATALYTGIATDCGFFRYSNTTPSTMCLAAELLAAGVKPNVISEALERKSYAHVQSMATAMQTIELLDNGRVAGVFLNQELTASMESTEGFIDVVRTINGVDVAVLLKCIEEKLCRVSMRSRYTDVSKIAVSLGGGGHIRAAGCTLRMPFLTAKQTLLSAVSRAIGENR